MGYQSKLAHPGEIARTALDQQPALRNPWDLPAANTRVIAANDYIAWENSDGTYGWAGADYDLWSKGVLEAIDYQTGKIRWSHQLGPGSPSAGVLTTASGLTFTGDVYGNLLALDTSNGKTLWHAGQGARMGTSPITYELDGRQYLITGSGGVLYAWTLPQH